jgi:hypothetical protein
MSAVDYTVWLMAPDGTRTALLDRFLSLEYALAVNEVGTATLTLPSDVPGSLLGRDARLEILRQPAGLGAQLVGETHWLVRGRTRTIGSGGERRWQITAVSALELLGRRVVPYYLAQPQGTKTGPADDILKALARENLGALATDATRSLAAWLTVAPDQSAGPQITKKAASYRNLLDVAREIAGASEDPGPAIAFDIVRTGDGLELRTYPGQRGTDRRAAGVATVGPDLGSLVDVTWTEDWSDEVTFVYAGGQALEQQGPRPIGTAQDATRIAASPFNRREEWVDARNTDTTTTASLVGEAQTALKAGRPKRTLRGTLIDLPGARLGVEWGWGDRLLALIDGETVPITVTGLHVTYANGAERIETTLRADD